MHSETADHSLAFNFFLLIRRGHLSFLPMADGLGAGGFFPFFFGSAVLVVYWAIELAMFAALLFCILSWVNQTSALYRTLSYLCYPFLAPIKKFIPVWKNIDFSAIVFFLVANIVLALLAPLT